MGLDWDLKPTPCKTEEEIKEINNIYGEGKYDIYNHTFRGKLIVNSKLLSDELKYEALADHDPESCVDYAMRLEKFLYKIDKYKLDKTIDIVDYNTIRHAVLWLRFWGENGYGYEANY